MSTRTVHTDKESTVQLYDNQTTVPAIPAAGAGVDISAMRKNSGASEQQQLLEIEKASGAGDVTLTGPVKIYAEFAGRVGYIGQLKEGGNIVLNTPASGAGYKELVNVVGIYDRIALVPAGVSGGGFDAFLTPVGGVRR